MSGQDSPPYEVRYAPGAGEGVAGLPHEARHALAAVLKDVAADPMSAGMTYDPRMSAEIRTIPFGDGGLLVFTVLVKRRQVVVAEVMWAD